MADGIQRYRVVPIMDPEHSWSPAAEFREDENGKVVFFSDVQARLEAADAVVSTAKVALRCDQGMACECHRDLARALAVYRSVGKEQEAA